MASEPDLPPADPDARSRALLERWQVGGDVDALDELLRSEVDLLARRLRARGGAVSASHSASDLAQEAVLRLLRLDETPTFDDPRALRAYLWTSAWRLLANQAQRPGRALVRLSDSETGTLSGMLGATGGLGAIERDDQRTALEVVVNLLDENDREALTLVYFRGLSVEDAARAANVTRGAFDVRLMRARRRLAERLVDWADVVG
ncbi:MAG: sigma-70 family RNA polymerase sigma factor [Planctomycetes bacterium]|nr:sigma-70 family RNA polymerase sigma factor [Planctomycetota bacterium]